MTAELFMELFKYCPVIAICLVMLWYMYKSNNARIEDYKSLVKETREDAKKRESKLHNLLDSMVKKFDILEELKEDMKEIKSYIEK